MTNLKGIRAYVDPTDGARDHAIAYKDITSLGIIAPFSITARCRIYRNIPTPATVELLHYTIGIEYGGATDQLSHLAGLVKIAGAAVGSMERGVSLNQTAKNVWNVGQDTHDSYTWQQETWFWMQLNVNIDRELTIKIKEDTGTTKPTTWDYETTSDDTIDATPEQEVQEVFIQVCIDPAFAEAGIRAIIEVDEIYMEQD